MYRGESINIAISGKDDASLANVNFTVYIYKDGCPSVTYKKTKSQCTAQNDGSYLCTFPASVSASLPLCSYTVEVYDSTNGKVSIQRHAFSLEASAASEDLNSTDAASDDDDSSDDSSDE